MANGAVAMMELIVEDDQIKIREERHYRLVPKAALSDAELDELRRRE